jgi:segregation and condensation protein B
MTSRHSIKSAFEAMMFIWGEPLEAKTAADVVNITEKEALEVFAELKEDYNAEGRGLRVRQINKSFQFITAPENSEYIERLCTPVKKRKLSQSALEVLAIIAYKQPVTRGQIEAVRGIKCDRVVEGLAEKGLVEEQGRSNGIGRPILYGTTDQFLQFFGFSSLKELPDIGELENEIEVPEGAEDSVSLNQISFGDIASEISSGGHAAVTDNTDGDPGREENL